MFKIEAYSERFKGVFNEDIKLEKLAGDFRFLEGPIWHPIEKHLIFSDIMGNALYKWQEDKGVVMIRPNSYLANGNTYNKNGEMLTCEHGTSRVTKTDSKGNYSVVTDKYNGKELNSPNDIVCSKANNIYFTDPNPGRCERVGIPREKELPFQGVYMFDIRKEELILLDDTFELPNGLCFSNDEKQLFVNDSRRHHIKVFDIKDDGTVENGRLFANLKTDGLGVADGLKFNVAGMLFCSAPGGIQIFDDQGELIGRIYTPEVTANFTWGSEDLKDMYFASSTSLYRLRTNIKGNKLF